MLAFCRLALWCRLRNQLDIQFLGQSDHFGILLTDSPGKVVKEDIVVIVSCCLDTATHKGTRFEYDDILDASLLQSLGGKQTGRAAADNDDFVVFTALRPEGCRRLGGESKGGRAAW